MLDNCPNAAADSKQNMEEESCADYGKKKN